VREVAEVVETRESVLFTRQVGMLHRWYEGRSFPLEDEQFAVLFLEVTARVQADARRNAILRLGDLLREMTSIPDMTRAAAEIVGVTLHASRAGFGRLERGDEEVVVETDWTQPGLASVVGRHRLNDYGALRGHLLEGTALIIDDVLTDPRTTTGLDRLLAIDVRALVNMPVHERGRAVAVLIVHDREPRTWEPEDLAFIRNVADRVEAGVARLRAEAEQKLLNEELSHRMKNMMAMVQAIAGQTLKSVPDREPVRAFEKRIHALSAAHDVLLQQNWSAAQISAVVHSVLGTFDLYPRFEVSGPGTDLGPRATLSLSLLLHELTTNALKHGSLSNETGRVSLTWRLEEERGDPVLILVWREQGGPPAREPDRKGFGSRLIRMGLVGTGGVELRYAPTGLEAEFTAPLSQVQLS
jgi:two-component sensor histidine kinase